MRTRAIAIAALLVVPLAARQAPPRDAAAPGARAGAPPGTGAIAGTVIGEPSLRPLARAAVAVAGLDDGTLRIVGTDDEGRFRLAGLAPGRYLVSASKAPYLEAAFGARRPGRPGTPIALAKDEQRTDLVFRLRPAAVITGTVRDEHGLPVPGVAVELVDARVAADANPMANPAAMLRFLRERAATDDRGEYRLAGLPPGEYLVSVTPGGMAGLEARVVTAADLQGAEQAIRDAARQPAARAPLLPPSTVVPPPGRTGNEAGGLGDIQAFLPAMPPMPLPPGGMPPGTRTVGFATVYHPGTTDAASAAVVGVGFGDERRGVDILVRPVPTARVEGIVRLPDGEPATGIMVRLRSSAGAVSLFSQMAGLSRMQTTRQDGAFAIAGVAPGRYILEARRMSPAALSLAGPPGASPNAPPPLFAQMEIDVSGETVSGLDVRLQTGLSVSGRIRVEGTRREPPADLSSMMVMLQPARGANDIFALVSGIGRPGPDGRFEVTGLMPGEYTVMSTSLQALALEQTDWPGQTVTIGGRDWTDLPIAIRENVTDVVITRTDATQELSGTFQDESGRPATDYTVVLFPADRRYWLPQSRRILVARPATDGRFTFAGLLAPPPGAYLLAAVTDLADGEQYDRALLEELSAAAVPVRIEAGRSAVQNLRVKNPVNGAMRQWGNGAMGNAGMRQWGGAAVPVSRRPAVPLSCSAAVPRPSSSPSVRLLGF